MEIRPMFRGLYGLGCLLAALATPPAGAAPLFRPCEDVAIRSKSEQLRQALWQGEGCVGDECRDYYRVGVCLPLGRKALIYEDQETGTSFQGLYYLRLDQPDMEPERLTTSVQKITEFRTTNGRRFALIEERVGIAWPLLPFNPSVGTDPRVGQGLPANNPGQPLRQRRLCGLRAAGRVRPGPLRIGSGRWVEGAGADRHLLPPAGFPGLAPAARPGTGVHDRTGPGRG